MKALRLTVLLLAGVLVIGPLGPAECHALEYCWTLSYPGMTTPPETIRVGVLDLGNGHYVLSGQAKIILVITPNQYNTFIVSGSAEMINNSLDVSLRLTGRGKLSLLYGDSAALGTIMLYMRLNPTTLNGDYARVIDATDGLYQAKGTFFDGTVTSTPCSSGQNGDHRTQAVKTEERSKSR
ncbi:MAG: hypothetical protein HQK60_00045 [Deltaproteobacteria bacterium]|nr:hypothetical protein [Deltaproteobacteria bacterium]